MDELIHCVEEHERWTKQTSAPVLSYESLEPKSIPATEIKRQIKLVQVGLAFSSPAGSTDERTSLQILSSMLSAGQSSVLRRKLILEGEFTDRLRTLVTYYKEAGMFLTSFAIKPNDTSKALGALTETVRDLKKNAGEFKENFERAKSHAVGSFSASIDRRMMWRTLVGAWETLRRGHCSWDEWTSSLESLSFQQFKHNVIEIVRPERTALVLAGNIKKGITKTVRW